jgi:class 3 adenylate cyclase
MWGDIGSRHKFKYGPLGNTVNLASRVQGATKYLKTRILLTRSVRDRLKEDFALRRLCQAGKGRRLRRRGSARIVSTLCTPAAARLTRRTIKSSSSRRFLRKGRFLLRQILSGLAQT